MVGELMCETKYSSVKIYVDERYRQICFEFRDIISDSKMIYLYCHQKIIKHAGKQNYMRFDKSLEIQRNMDMYFKKNNSFICKI